MVTAPKAAHHHHHHDAAAIVREIEHECDARGLRLTPLRREVLELVAKARRPVKAYDLLESLRDRHAGAAPPTVYRALDFLSSRVSFIGWNPITAMSCVTTLRHRHIRQ